MGQGVVLFHSAMGLRPAVGGFADRIRDAHAVEDIGEDRDFLGPPDELAWPFYASNERGGRRPRLAQVARPQ